CVRDAYGGGWDSW
nr:immunoglobulin heavy chain junction region [Macaca mulatta]MOX62073.1 immunoglobulin heavy chain junction region [Macaca mulatta]MOX62910.1 immunoglobulin heavy chain junction region [Macaca mulatta]MOX63391.1 immunoglobulin heavy chain junction region [Macaca mulatta]MOX63781.1 immunoglobulin heavy chain junction region [Macaca mulatta]